MQELTIRQIKTTDADYGKVYDLREEILRKPIGLSLKDEDLSADESAIILVAEYDEQIIGCVMLQPMGNPAAFKLRQMAVAKDWQAKGIGRALVLFAEQRLSAENISSIILHARITAVAFYEKLGYDITSSPFTEVGIPHVIMKKQIG